MRYGLPYQGSKNAIAEKIVALFPTAENFYDLFAGGCAITHCALLKGGFKNYYANDIDDIPQLFLKAINGEYANETRWISRDDFQMLKNSDLYVSLCWSFGNNRKDYLYSKEIEPWKRALHYARVLHDISRLAEFGINSDGSQKDILAHYEEYKEKYLSWVLKQNREFKHVNFNVRLQSLARLQRLQNLQRPERLERLKITQKSYENVKIKPNSVIYCDIPYEKTRGYVSGEFNHKKFYDWACNQNEPVFISSYNISDERFVKSASFSKMLLYAAQGNGKLVENIFVPKKQQKELPITLFDLL